MNTFNKCDLEFRNQTYYLLRIWSTVLTLTDDSFWSMMAPGCRIKSCKIIWLFPLRKHLRWLCAAFCQRHHRFLLAASTNTPLMGPSEHSCVLRQNPPTTHSVTSHWLGRHSEDNSPDSSDNTHHHYQACKTRQPLVDEEAAVEAQILSLTLSLYFIGSVWTQYETSIVSVGKGWDSSRSAAVLQSAHPCTLHCSTLISHWHPSSCTSTVNPQSSQAHHYPSHMRTRCWHPLLFAAHSQRCAGTGVRCQHTKVLFFPPPENK